MGARLACPVCGDTYDDDGVRAKCDGAHPPGLLVTRYGSRFEPEDAAGIERYRCWLPLRRTLRSSPRTVVYLADALGRHLGLKNLWIAFNGYWPERGAAFETTTFKDLEAACVVGRLGDDFDRTLVVASAGNSAAAFALQCSRHRVRCVIILPESGLDRMRFDEPLHGCVKVIALVGFTDYFDAITLGERVSAMPGCVPEGGAANVARRDGMGTVMLSAVEASGSLPDYYVQAVGSGAGAIGAFEMSQRLVQDGRFGARVPRMLLVQNLPFVPMYLSWKSLRRDLISINRDDAKKQIRQIAAHVLSNRRPPYGLRGGVFDVLTSSQGDMLVADNAEALAASRLFARTEGVDVDPAGAVALAALEKASRCGLIERDAAVLLNVTGGGFYRREKEHARMAVKPDVVLDEEEIFRDEVIERIEEVLAR